MEILVITGPPYSGKGTQCEILEKQLKFKHISTGNRVRWEKENNTELGKITAKYEEKGNLIPDSIMKDLYRNILEENANEAGIILDGYPRTTDQVNDFMDLLEEKNLKVKDVINIEVPTEELLKRAKHRAATSSREDDKNADIHLRRIEVFETVTKPSIEALKARLDVNTFDGMGSISEITERILETINCVEF